MNSQHSTMLNLLILDVLNGTGIIKFVSNALKIGFSMLMEPAFQFLINVLLMMPMEHVSHASKDMT